MKTKSRLLVFLFVQMIISNLLISCCEKFQEPDPVNVTDIEGNDYKVIRIGNQLWMKENLKALKFNDGTDIPVVTDSVIWKSLAAPACCWYNNDSASYNGTFGVLYNWHAVNTGLLCPAGWHVPSDDEWKTLMRYLGGQNVAGGKLKETGTSHWNSPNNGAGNESEFTGLPGGRCDEIYGRFKELGLNGYWWTATLGKAQLSHGVQFYGPIHYYLNYLTGSLNSQTTSGYLWNGRNQGNSVRCIRDR